MNYNIYCDESCHLEHDNERVMVLGAIKIPKNSRKNTLNHIRTLKEKHNMNRNCEFKWNKVSPSKLNFYKDVINYFFDNNELSFRAVIINKSQIRHNYFNQSHDSFYYKVYYQLLSRVISPSELNNIYLDIKDTKSSNQIFLLKKYLSNGIYDFNTEHIKNVQNINSKESEILQLTDLLIGAISYINRECSNNVYSSIAKKEIINLIIQRSKYNLKQSTFLSEEKFNLFFMELQ